MPVQAYRPWWHDANERAEAARVARAGARYSADAFRGFPPAKLRAHMERALEAQERHEILSAQEERRARAKGSPAAKVAAWIGRAARDNGLSQAYVAAVTEHRMLEIAERIGEQLPGVDPRACRVLALRVMAARL